MRYTMYDTYLLTYLLTTGQELCRRLKQQSQFRTENTYNLDDIIIFPRPSIKFPNFQDILAFLDTPTFHGQATYVHKIGVITDI